MREIKPHSRLRGTVRMPGSKSITHRALLSAALARGESTLHGCLDCEDTRLTAAALTQLGATVRRRGQRTLVLGIPGTAPPFPGRRELYLANSGTSFRLLLSFAALQRGAFLLTGSPRMRERPIGPLVQALADLGVEVSCVEKQGLPPVVVEARGIAGGTVGLEGKESSQFVSSLLLSAPYAQKDVVIEVEGDLVSKPYVDITLEVMEKFGVRVDRSGYRTFRVASGQEYTPQEMDIQGDVSSASYFWAAAAVTGGEVTTENIHPSGTPQGDIRFLDLLERMGCRVERGADRVRVCGGRLRGVEVDMSAMPDMVPSLAAVALFCRGRTAIRKVGHLRFKECDRLHAIALQWRRLGATVEEHDDGLILQGNAALSGAVVNPQGDHRLAMSLAVVGLRVPGVRIENERCVSKSFPHFWDLWESL